MKTINHDKIALFKVFSGIPLDIAGSNLDNNGYLPSDEDKQYMNEDIYQFAVQEYNSRNAKVLFKNVSLRCGLWCFIKCISCFCVKINFYI